MPREKRIDPRSVTEMHVKMGQQLRLARLTAGMSQSELGASIGVTFQQIQKYEKGVNRIDTTRLMKIAQVLNVSIDYFIGEQLHTKPSGARSEFNAMMASREGVQMINAMINLNDNQRQFVIDIARKLPRLGA
ncbi:helix-turn-helix domain-containing protein [Bradyrhizobium sp. S3.7.6]